jgi:hypothetical protein
MMARQGIVILGAWNEDLPKFIKNFGSARMNRILKANLGGKWLCPSAVNSFTLRSVFLFKKFQRGYHSL